MGKFTFRGFSQKYPIPADMPKLAGLDRNAWQFTPGTGGSFPPEWVANLARNTQKASKNWEIIFLAKHCQSLNCANFYEIFMTFG
jgi:hypothetical protein